MTHLLCSNATIGRFFPFISARSSFSSDTERRQTPERLETENTNAAARLTYGYVDALTPVYITDIYRIILILLTAFQTLIWVVPNDDVRCFCLNHKLPTFL